MPNLLRSEAGRIGCANQDLPLRRDDRLALQKTVAGEPAPAYRPGIDGYADWVILAVQGFKEYLNHDYRKLMDVLREMPRIAKSLGLTVKTLPHYSTVCAKASDFDETVASDA